MQNFAAVLSFAWTYLRRYRGRLVASVLFAILFALANACFVPAARTLLDRFSKRQPREQVQASSPDDSWIERMKAKGQELNKKLQTAIDPWLPRQNEKITTRQILGMLLFLPTLV